MSFVIIMIMSKRKKKGKNYAHVISYIAARLSSEVESIYHPQYQQSIDLNYWKNSPLTLNLPQCLILTFA